MKYFTNKLRRSVLAIGFHRLLRWGLGGLFIYAGALKLSDPSAFVIQLEKYGLLPAVLLDPVSWLLPLIEILAGVATLLGLRGGAEIISLLLVVFLAAIVHAWWSGLDVPCGCFSREDEQHRFGLQQAIIRDLVMLAGAAILLVRRRRVPLQATGAVP